MDFERNIFKALVGSLGLSRSDYSRSTQEHSMLSFEEFQDLRKRLNDEKMGKVRKRKQNNNNDENNLFD